MNAPITITLDVCTVVAQRNGDLITFEFRAHAGAEPFTLAGPEVQRLCRVLNILRTQLAIERTRQEAAEQPPPPSPNPDPLTRFIAWLRADVTGGAHGN